MKTSGSLAGTKTARLYLSVLSHTHWDREWYLSFQAFRLKLADLVDQLLDLLDRNPDFRYFMLDGQTIVLEDYLAVRPDSRERLAMHIRSGRLLVGPWYILPDEFLVSGESIIRNLLIGHRVAREFGTPMKVGYLPDCFGHIAEIPQILRGFGIDSAVIWRGVSDEVLNTEFLWRSPDGSEVLAIHLPQGYFNAHRLPEDPQQFLSRIDVIRGQLEPRATTPYLVLMNGSDHAFPEGELPNSIAEANRALGELELIHTNLPEVIRAIKEIGRGEGTTLTAVKGELRDSKRAPLLPGVLSTRMWIKQRNFECESLLEKWAEPFAAWSVMAQHLPEAGPPSGNGKHGKSSEGYRHKMALRQAWRYLLQNHPHDSICGCSVDQVHEEMKVRFDWSEQIAGSLTDDSLRQLVTQIDTESAWSPSAAGSFEARVDRTAIVVFNPIGGPRNDFARAWVPVPPARGFKLVDEEGRWQPCQIMARRDAPLISADATRDSLLAMFNGTGYPDEVKWTEDTLRFLEKSIMGMGGQESSQLLIANMRVEPAIRPGWAIVEIDALDVGERRCCQIRKAMESLAMMVRAREDIALFQFRIKRSDQLELGFVAEEVPAFGYRTYHMVPTNEPVIEGSSKQAERIENEFLSVEVDPDRGTLTVTDKETGSVLERLNHFVDSGDCGDEYNYAAPIWDTVVDAPGSPPQVDLVQDGPARSTLKITLTYDLPAELTPTRRSRTYQKVSATLTSYVSLSEGVKRVDVRTVVENLAKDHRLRVHFPAGLLADVSSAESHFGVVERSTAVRPSTPDWAEDAIGTHPQKRFVDLSDGSRGLSVAARGLPEYEILSDGRESTIAVTLLRCIGWLSRDDLKSRRGHAGPGLETPGAQCQGTHAFEYAIIPHGATWQESFEEAHRFGHPARVVTTDNHHGTLPSAASFMEVDSSKLVVSAIKLPEEGDGLIVRLYNVTMDPIEGALSLHWPCERADLVDLEEKFVEELAVDGNRIALGFGPAEMTTVRFHFR